MALFREGVEARSPPLSSVTSKSQAARVAGTWGIENCHVSGEAPDDNNEARARPETW